MIQPNTSLGEKNTEVLREKRNERGGRGKGGSNVFFWKYLETESLKEIAGGDVCLTQGGPGAGCWFPKF